MTGAIAPGISNSWLDTAPVRWARANLFPSWFSTAVTLVIGYLVLKALFFAASWALFSAVWTVEGTNTQVCRDLRGIGACWALIAEKHRFILFGTYPFDQHWRPTAVIL